jgi:hypothetical protein
MEIAFSLITRGAVKVKFNNGCSGVSKTACVAYAVTNRLYL